MNWWKTAAVSAGLVAAAGLGAAVAPVANGQSRTPRVVSPRAEVFSFAGGSRIGVSISELDAEDTKGRVTAGVMVDEVDDDSPASKAGIKKGDVVVEFDGERVRSVRQFTRLVNETPSGRTIQTAVMRDGQRVSMSITPREGSGFSFLSGDGWNTDAIWNSDAITKLRQMPPTPPPALAVRPPTPPRPMEFFWRSGNRLGVTIEELSSQLAEYFGTKDGLLVTSVETNSAAAKAGVKAGDVITSVNGNSVESGSELRQRLTSIDAGEEFSLGIVRDKRTMTLKGKLESPTARRRGRTIL
jgi:serine protease Do